jgi:hypothetical protein
MASNAAECESLRFQSDPIANIEISFRFGFLLHSPLRLLAPPANVAGFGLSIARTVNIKN